MLPFVKLTTWSKIDKASRIPPSAFCAITFRASGSAVTPSQEETYSRCSTISAIEIREKSYIWQRDRMVGKTLCFSVVARINKAWWGGSSSVFRNALKAAELSICTSSMINTLYFPIGGGIRTWSISERISSTELLEAASSSWMLYERCSLKALHDSHSLQASPSAVGFRQLIVLAKIRAQEVLPTPRGPQKR